MGKAESLETRSFRAQFLTDREIVKGCEFDLS